MPLREQWINPCPYPGKKNIMPIPVPVKHMKHVNDMAKDRKPLWNSGLKPQ
jgi:hypothetical protein